MICHVQSSASVCNLAVEKAVINAMQFKAVKEMIGMSLTADERGVLERAQTYIT